MSRRVVAVIQARLGSMRFPGKALARLDGRPLIEHVIERVLQVPSVDCVAVAVPTTDLALIRVLREHPVKIVLGPEHDVLQRYWLTALVHRADVIMRVTADCPLWSPAAGASVLHAYLTDTEERQFWSNDTQTTGWADGTDVEVFSRGLLLRARYARSTMSTNDCEHVTTWMRRVLGKQCGVHRRVHDEASNMKLSIDTPEDLARVQALSPRLALISNDPLGRAIIYERKDYTT
jgi:spore coat polysaccharide biosynthesis protein SpsF